MWEDFSTTFVNIYQFQILQWITLFKIGERKGIEILTRNIQAKRLIFKEQGMWRKDSLG